MAEYTLVEAAERLNQAGIHAGGDLVTERKIRDAGDALKVLAAYAGGSYDQHEAVDVIMADMLVSMRRLCFELNLDYDLIDRQAQRYLSDER